MTSSTAGFLEYFKDVPFQQEVSQELLDWLNRPEVLSDYASWDEEQALKNLGFSEEEIERMLKERMEEQTEEHNGGRYWVGTHGMSTFGNSGLSPKGIRVGARACTDGLSGWPGERKFRDFRRDNTLDTRRSRWPYGSCGNSPGWWTSPPRSSTWTTPSKTPPTMAAC